MATLLVGLVMLVGLVGVLLPLLPGTALILAAGAGWAVLVVGEGTARWVVVAVMALLLAVGMVLKYALPGRSMSGRLPVERSSWGRPGPVPASCCCRRWGLLLGGALGVFWPSSAARRPGRGLAQHRAGAQGRRLGCSPS
jgi:membrane protein DedA with SNARE-associated domain